MYSGGKGSFAVADWVKTNYPNDNILLYFTDTKWEDADLYRFLHEGATKLQLPLLYHADGRDPVQLMFDQRVVFNSRIGQCSIILKMKVSDDYLKKGIKPNEEVWYNKQWLKDDDFITDATLYFGIDWTEEHRQHSIKKNWQPFNVHMPLIDNMIDEDEILAKYDIKQPRLYDLGFAHNNCLGRCVKAGQGHFKNLHAKLPDVFKDTRERERALSDFTSAYHYIKNQYFIPDQYKLSPEDTQRKLDELIETYKPYLYDNTGNPPQYVHPAEQHTAYVVDKLPIERYFNVVNGKLKTVKVRRKNMKKYLYSTRYRLVETRHLIKNTYSFMKKQTNNVTHSYLLEYLEHDILNNGQQIDMFDIGGCGCFIA